MSKSRASADAMDQLHKLVAEVLTSEIKAGAASEEGLSPQMIAQAIKFLKDNNVTAPAGLADRTEGLMKELEALEVDLDGEATRLAN